ncbi:DNA repair protein RecO [Candidatus Woesebacteria bacterium GWB1_43_5]|uniref:DNA repair protein RecO n=1 Tax=Candidatus Woesebacteria bacterium GWB1_43_5 TaxID=1802474 RepID=A0A1F7WSJ1_9BACT|nr:MAG: DNA repair protein RecO [Candidatus Woesebacteria bacterium GWB1_43_5]
MRPRTYASEGLILARRNFGEADRIIIIFTKNFGKISFIAKGVRRPKSRKRGHLEIFSHIKFQAAKGRGLDILTEAEIIDNFSQTRKDLKKVSVAYYFCEVVGRTTHENESHPAVLELVLEYLNKLETAKSLKKLRLEFAVRALVDLGFWPKGKLMLDPDMELETVIERKLSSIRVGKKVLGTSGH